MAVTNKALRSRLIKGFKFLDDKKAGWDQVFRNDPDKVEDLDMGSCRRCLLANIFGDYFTAREELSMDLDQAVKLGFTALGGEVTGRLTPIAKQLLRERIASTPPQAA